VFTTVFIIQAILAKAEKSLGEWIHESWRLKKEALPEVLEGRGYDLGRRRAGSNLPETRGYHKVTTF